ncbi:unnamed protein product [Peronospora farinosa]|uniref:Uncharacterized protein n=1 Tax=Peronospora farinosa TaxID=134698 RepID=A0AAV0U922_9STRA|nr:unnamed protein product [Peronospora farinosa]
MKVFGKRSKRHSSRESAKSRKSVKSGNSSTPVSAVLLSGVSIGSSPIMLDSSEDDPSDDNEVILTVLAKSRSSVRRPAAKRSAVLPFSAVSPVKPALKPQPSLNQSMFGSFDS